ncbi:hypothetical protein E4U17_006732 [Claviceps sp. LM77 group G4]|nr:hypothetical protein E4U17_006732 [Claviceps sp. LM77 group G4]KAG6071893.1 hypothetical protein E4U16_005801 [Claviceps sp. LM84 group G4]
MRPPRIAILVLFTAASLFIIYRGLTTNSNNVAATYPATPPRSRSVFGFMYYNTPFSLFPPNAAISLTDDNSTSFAARPAAFGPKLAHRGLSGQLWVGSGFGEDGLDTDGELGCSDIPGWGSSSSRTSLKTSFKAASAKRLSGKSQVSKKGGNLLDPDNLDFIAKAKTQARHAKNDNTDDYLTEELSGTLSRRDASSGSSAHADIQSIQEAAEIEGKVVLLKRGGCGFLEKVMWAQRRGAVAVIVGDNQKGGPLIQMFAHGDEVDNVTVPSVFTARTTAQLLSSLTQPGSFIEDTIDDNGNPVLKVQQSATVKYRKRSPARSEAAVAAASRKDHADLRTKQTTGGEKKKEITEPSPASSKSNQRRGIFSHVSKGSSARPVDSESRPPRSGRLDWVLVEEWNDEKDKVMSDTLGKTKKPKTKSDGDEFVIGVHDWRDPDLVGSTGKHEYDGKTTSLQADTRIDSSRPRPKSGTAAGSKSSKTTSKHRGLMSVLFGVGGSDVTPEPQVRPPPTPPPPPPEAEEFQERPLQSGRRIVHEGLWVTITPSSSASPFFDTLLVLVISPLVTLTVVYALLILRAKIRRRRCRAPKSVVDQLPVRTYHTVSSAVASSMSPRLSSPTGATPTTPLLQHSTPIPRSRPRSRTTTGVLESPNFLGASPTIPTLIPQEASRMSRRSGFEKGTGGFSAEWRKYMGRQVECVVCLEEYVDGVSRVMRLPCGHEFHADCITPWLTTRRRTCPICKGDVVRSMQRGKGSGPRYEPFREDDYDDVDDDDGDDDDDDREVAEGSGSGTGVGTGTGIGPAIGLGIGIGSGNNSPERVIDLEQGTSTTEARNEPQPSHWGSSWLDYLSGNFHARTRAGLRSPSTEH